MVVVNLRPDTDAETEFVPFDRLRVRRVLSRIAADLDRLAHGSSQMKLTAMTEDQSQTIVDAENLRAEHRHRLAEPEPDPLRRSPREERVAMREALGLPPYQGH